MGPLRAPLRLHQPREKRIEDWAGVRICGVHARSEFIPEHGHVQRVGIEACICLGRMRVSRLERKSYGSHRVQVNMRAPPARLKGEFDMGLILQAQRECPTRFGVWGGRWSTSSARMSDI